MSPLAVLAFARTWWKAGAGAVAGALLALPVGQCMGSQAERDRSEAAAAQARELAAARNDVAKDRAADQHLRDDRATRKAEEDLNRADDANPDARPSDNRRDRLCGVMRQQAAERGTAVPSGCGPRR